MNLNENNIDETENRISQNARMRQEEFVESPQMDD
jgi:hypothetical protein